MCFELRTGAAIPVEASSFFSPEVVVLFELSDSGSKGLATCNRCPVSLSFCPYVKFEERGALF
jgi:hypothetical protein